jgi:hypothetical protein
MAAEIWANSGTRKPGWTPDQSKITDYVLFVWLDTKEGKSVLQVHGYYGAVDMVNGERKDKNLPNVAYVSRWTWWLVRIGLGS